MNFAVFFSQLSEYGTAPLLIAQSFIIGWMVKKISEVEKSQKKQMDAFKTAITGQLSEMQKFFDDKIDRLREEIEHDMSSLRMQIETLENRVGCVERDYLPREDHYRDMGGWRTELGRVYEALLNLKKD